MYSKCVLKDLQNNVNNCIKQNEYIIYFFEKYIKYLKVIELYNYVLKIYS